MTKPDIKEIVEVAKKASKEIMEIYEKEYKIDSKIDRDSGFESPLTEADIKSNEVIVSKLNELYPEIPLLSEENNEVPYEKRKEWNLLWVVDPLDGTKEFIQKNGEFTVNIARVKNQEPILGVVNAPTTDTCYFADENGAFKEEKGILKKLGENSENEGENALKVVVSKSHMNDGTKEFIDRIKRGRNLEFESKGSSLKLCMVAEGKADIYPRLGPTMEWDTAAAHAIVKFSGKNVKNYETSEELKYNKENLLNPWFVVS